VVHKEASQFAPSSKAQFIHPSEVRGTAALPSGSIDPIICGIETARMMEMTGMEFLGMRKSKDPHKASRYLADLYSSHGAA
jgi:hypothetical protein